MSKRNYEDSVDYLDRINGMTSDELYKELVAESGRADGITDEMDDASRNQESEMEARRMSGGAQQPESPSPSPSVSSSADSPSDSGRDISYGIVRNEDFTKYREQREAERRKVRAAQVAALAAQQRERDALLASGRYFDDGRGNLKLRKQFRKETRRGSNGRVYNETLPDDGSGNAAVRNAGQRAYDDVAASLAAGGFEQNASNGQRAVAFLRQDQRNADEIKAAKAKRRSAINLIGSRILSQSLRAMNEPNENVSGGVRYTSGDRNGVGIARENGRTHLADNGVGGYKTGGFVTEEQLKAFNDELNAQGADFAVTGVVCQQKKDANGYEVGKPTFYIQFRGADGRQFARMYTLDKAYDEARRAFKDHYQGSSDDDAEAYAVEAFGDVFGWDAKRKEAQSAVNEKTRRETLERDRKFNLEVLKAVAEMEKAGKPPVNALDFFSKNPKLLENYMTDYERDEQGNIKMMENPTTGNMEPVRVTLSPEETAKRVMELYNGLGGANAETVGGQADNPVLTAMKALLAPSPQGASDGAPSAPNPSKPVASGSTSTEEFKPLSRDDYSALSDEEKARYREAWKRWRASQLPPVGDLGNGEAK